MSPRTKRITRRATGRPPASGRKPTDRISARDMSMTADELQTFHRQFQPLFQRREQRAWSLLYLCGQLSNLERKTIEPMALFLLGADPNAIRGMQQFIGQGEWDSAPLLQHAQGLVSTWLSEEEGVVIVDGSGFPKQGRHSVGVARQYCGALGKIANCQEGVFLVAKPASRRGYAFVDERLSVPEERFSNESRKRWHACGIPENLAFRTEPELGLEMITALVEHDALPFRWVTCDEKYGKIPAFLDGIAALDKWYLAEVPVDTRVWLRRPAIEPPGRGLLGRPRLYPRVKRTAPPPLELRALMTQLPRTRWQRRKIQEGSKGPLIVELACVRVTSVCEALPGPRCWAIFRRSLGSQPETKYYLCNAPADYPQTELARLTGMRWPIETALEEGKGEVGLDHFETRTWPGWHHHLLHSFLAHLFLMRLRLLFQKKSSAHYSPSSATGRTCYSGRGDRSTRSLRHLALPPIPQPCRLSFSQETYSFTSAPANKKRSQKQSLVVITVISL